MQLGTGPQWRAWFTRGWPLWGSVVLACAGLAWWSWPGLRSPDTLRQIGLVYEAFGVLAVLAEFVLAMKKHRVDGLPVRLWNYLRAAPPLVRHVTISASMHATGGSDSLFATATVSSPQPTTTDERLALLERQFTALSSRLGEVSQQVKAEAAARAAALADHAAKIDRVSSQVRESIKDIEVGSLKLSMLGVLWLLVGMVLTTATPEVCKWVLRCA